MDALIALLSETLVKVWGSFAHNWPYLLASILVAVAMKMYLDPQKVSAFLMRHRRAGVLGATAVAVGTPLCSCGTTAIVLGMMASMMPWAPIIAFMVSSPLTSPEGLFYSAGLFGWPFAWAFFITSILLGLLGGLAGEIFERRGLLKNQTRFAAPSLPTTAPERISVGLSSLQPQPAASCCTAQTAPRQPLALSDFRPPSRVYLRESAPAVRVTSGCCSASVQPVAAAAVLPAPSCGCGGAVSLPSDGPSEAAPTGSASSSCCSASTQPAAAAAVLPAPSCGCGGSVSMPSNSAGEAALPQQDSPAARPAVTPELFLREVIETGKRLLIMFFSFTFIGYLLNGLIPAAWVSAVFGQGNVYSVPLAASLGLPLYINSEASLPLVRGLIEGGMSQGAAMAFLITGAGTSIGAITGALTIARWRVIAIVVGVLWVGAVAAGYIFNLLNAAGAF